MSTSIEDTGHPFTEHFAWLERLAHRLVRDPDAARDLAQDTWVAALRARRDDIATPRAFLRRVMKRTLGQGRRANRRRCDHQALVESKGDTPSASETVARAELGQRLTRLVLELDEPYRSTVLMRYADDLSPTEIARRTSVPLATVKSRLARARATLRDRWLRDHPAGHEWLPALGGLIPFGPRLRSAAPSHWFPTLSAAIAVNAKLIAVLVGAVVCGAALWSVSRSPASSAERASHQAERTAPVELTDVTPPDEATLDAPTERLATRRAESAPESPADESTAADPPPTRTFRGRVVDPERRPVAKIDVTWTQAGRERARATTDTSGHFELEAATSQGSIQADDPSVVNLFVHRVEASSPFDALLVVAPFRSLGGAVVNPDRIEVAGARVEFVYPPGFVAGFDAVFDGANTLEPAGDTNEFGRFTLERVPIVEGARVRATLDGFEPTEVPAPPYAAEDLELVLERSEAAEGTLRGIVLDERGLPVAGALVTLGERAVATAVDGTFQLDTADPPDANEVTAVARGHLPARYVKPKDEPSFPEFVELRLGGPPLELAGVVVDSEGEPLEGIQLWIDDPTEFGTIGDDLWTHLEYLAAPEESTYDPSSDAYFRTVYSDASGRFRIQGLLDREYQLKLLVRDRLHVHDVGSFAAGRKDVEVVVPEAEAGTFAGRIVSSDGAPVANACVDLRAHMFGGVSHVIGPVVTGEDGEFRFDGVVCEEAMVLVRGESVLPAHRAIRRADGETDVVVEVLCHFKVDLSASEVTAHGVGARDAEGNALQLYDMGAGGFYVTARQHFEGERSSAYGVSERVTEIALFEAGIEVRAIAVELRPGELEVIRP